jgi:hypothetical protein
MAKTPKPAIRGMLLYVIGLLILGIVGGAYFTLRGHPSDPNQRPASETIPSAPAKAPL